MASNVLATRLRKLLEAAIIAKTVVPEDGRRFDYALTAKGLDLFPLVMAVMAWGDKWAPGNAGPLIELRHSSCGKKTKPGLVCSACGEALTPSDLRPRAAAAYRPK